MSNFDSKVFHMYIHVLDGQKSLNAITQEKTLTEYQLKNNNNK